MATTWNTRTPQVLTTTNDVYTAMDARLDAIEARQNEAQQRHERHEQRSAWLLARIEEAQRLAQQMIDASRAIESEVR